jgi:hypothetical protein
VTVCVSNQPFSIDITLYREVQKQRQREKQLGADAERGLQILEAMQASINKEKCDSYVLIRKCSLFLKHFH